MKASARLIIPLWGVIYAEKLTSMTLPALLAPGNLPALCEAFDVEVVIVTETKLVELIKGSRSFQLVSNLCRTKFASLDDLMSDQSGDYGVVLTHALFRGFVDLGTTVTETYLLFLNADFILADGSYRHLAQLMLAGKRVIHSPSFRVVLEEIWPELEARADRSSMVLAVQPRDMVKLALDHKHLTVKARTVNQRFYHQWCMDQFYWYVDENTLIGCQWPVALVAIKPERVIMEPVVVWDFGYIPEAAPTLEPYFIDDSDDFFMLEPQKRQTGDELMRPGWISVDAVAKFLADYTTKEQRRCGQQLLKIHAGDLPLYLDRMIDESRRYMREITDRLPPQPVPHVDHPRLGRWFIDATTRINQMHSADRTRSARRQLSPVEARPSEALATAASTGPDRAGVPPTVLDRPTRRLARLVRRLHRKLFGSPPFLRVCHPRWLETMDVAPRLAAWRQSRMRILWLSSKDSLFRHLLNDRIDPTGLLMPAVAASAASAGSYDACLCELSPAELTSLPALHGKIRSLIRDGGRVLYHVNRFGPEAFGVDHFGTYDAFPDIDVATIRFYGTAATTAIRKLYFRVANSFPHSPTARIAAAGIAQIGMAPLTWLAHRRAIGRDPTSYVPTWTSAVIEFEIRKASRANAGGQPAPTEQDGRGRSASR